VPPLELLTFGLEKVQGTGWSRHSNSENKGGSGNGLPATQTA